METTYSEFCDTIAKDYGIDRNQIHKTYFNQFPVKNGVRKINSYSNAVIVDKKGNEFPYMLSQYKRNDEKLVDFDYIYTIRLKNLDEICKEANIELESKKCRICEGGGWTSQGCQYFYKDISCKI